MLHRVGRGYALAHANLDRMRRIQAATQALSAVLDPGDGATQFLAEVASGCSAQAAELTLTRGDTVQAHRFVASPDARRQVATGLDTALTRTVLAGPLPTHLVAQPRRPAAGGVPGPARRGPSPASRRRRFGPPAGVTAWPFRS